MDGHDMGELTQLPDSALNYLALSWSLGPWLVVSALAIAYGAGWWRLHRRGTPWPWMRSVSWLLGLMSLVLALDSAAAAAASALLSWHMVQHMVLSMLTPVFLLCGAPVTLALRALPSRGLGSSARRGLVRVLHSRPLAIVAHPITSSALFIGSLYALYLTPLLDLAMSSMVGHQLMLVHFVLVGCVFFGPLLAVDPWPHRLSPGARLWTLVVSMPFHAFFGVALMQASGGLSSHFTAATERLGLDAAADQSAAGGIAWGLGEVPLLLVGGIVFAQWCRSDLRHARRLDARADRDDDAALAAYNERLRQLRSPSSAQ